MKKLLFAIAALMTMTVANAQSVKEQIEASQNTAKELKSLTDKNAKESGAPEVDAFQKAVNDIAKQATENSDKLKALYEKVSAGGADPEVLKKDMDVVKAGIEKEVKEFTTAQDKAAAAKAVADLTSELGSASAMAKIKIAKKLKASTSNLNTTKDIVSLLVKETANQTNISSALLKAITSGAALQ